MIKEHKRYLQKQENLYWFSNHLDKDWYRRLYGGQWRLLHWEDEPTMGGLIQNKVWTKMGDDHWDGKFKVLLTKRYPCTGVDTKWKLYKQFIKELFKKIGGNGYYNHPF